MVLPFDCSTFMTTMESPRVNQLKSGTIRSGASQWSQMRWLVSFDIGRDRRYHALTRCQATIALPNHADPFGGASSSIAFPVKVFRLIFARCSGIEMTIIVTHCSTRVTAK